MWEQSVRRRTHAICARSGTRRDQNTCADVSLHAVGEKKTVTWTDACSASTRPNRSRDECTLGSICTAGASFLKHTQRSRPDVRPSLWCSWERASWLNDRLPNFNILNHTNVTNKAIITHGPLEGLVSSRPTLTYFQRFRSYKTAAKHTNPSAGPAFPILRNWSPKLVHEHC